jgi:RluA family pseudouridine synthase
MQYRVSKEEHGLSLLVFLKGKEALLSSKKIKKIIETGGCLVSGKVEVFSSRKLMEGEVIEADLTVKEPLKESVSIVFEDDYFLIVNKPPGLVCQEGEFQKSLPLIYKNTKLLHRLDKDTSGTLMLAKNSFAEKEGLALFSKRKIKKLYLACVRGEVKKGEGVIENFLAKKVAYAGQTLYGSSSKGEKAITSWRVLEKRNKSSLLLCDLKTGRTHQIRVHMSEMGHPILGDYLYGSGSGEAARQLLHSWKLVFIHPRTKQEIIATSPLPEDFKQALKQE